MPLLGAACATPSPAVRPTPATASDLGFDLPAATPPDAKAPAAAGRTRRDDEPGQEPVDPWAGVRPFRVRLPGTLAVGDSVLQARFDDTDDDSSAFFTFARGVYPDVMVDFTIGTGHQVETIAEAEEPGFVFQAGAQYALIGRPGELRIAPRFDLVLADEKAFEGIVEPDNQQTFGNNNEEDGNPTSRVSFQPGVVFGVPLTEGGAELYGNASGRFGDGTRGALWFGAGVRLPLGRAAFYTEAELLRQDARESLLVAGSGSTSTYTEAYLTAGFQFTLRERLDLHIGPSIGLTRESTDWRVVASMGVRF
jgi:hypothetical protein